MIGYETVVIDADGIHLDDIHIEGMKTGTDISVQHFGDDLHKVTFSIYSSNVEITEAVRLYGSALITERGDSSGQTVTK